MVKQVDEQGNGKPAGAALTVAHLFLQFVDAVAELPFFACDSHFFVHDCKITEFSPVSCRKGAKKGGFWLKFGKMRAVIQIFGLKI